MSSSILDSLNSRLTSPSMDNYDNMGIIEILEDIKSRKEFYKGFYYDKKFIVECLEYAKRNIRTPLKFAELNIDTAIAAIKSFNDPIPLGPMSYRMPEGLRVEDFAYTLQIILKIEYSKCGLDKAYFIGGLEASQDAYLGRKINEAKRMIKKLGGIKAAANKLCVSERTLYRWTSGFMPDRARVMLELLTK